VWGDTHVSLGSLLPTGPRGLAFRDAVSGHAVQTEILNGEPTLPLSRVFAHLPVALLELTA